MPPDLQLYNGCKEGDCMVHCRLTICTETNRTAWSSAMQARNWSLRQYLSGGTRALRTKAARHSVQCANAKPSCTPISRTAARDT